MARKGGAAAADRDDFCQFLEIFLQISKFPAAFFPDFQGVFPSTGLDVEICGYLASPGQGRNMDRSQGGKEIKQEEW